MTEAARASRAANPVRRPENDAPAQRAWNPPVAARLLEAASERQLWTMDDECDFRETFALHKEVAASIARLLGVRVSVHNGRASATEIPAEACEAYVRGNYLPFQINIDFCEVALTPAEVICAEPRSTR